MDVLERSGQICCLKCETKKGYRKMLVKNIVYTDNPDIYASLGKYPDSPEFEKDKRAIDKRFNKSCLSDLDGCVDTLKSVIKDIPISEDASEKLNSYIGDHMDLGPATLAKEVLSRLHLELMVNFNHVTNGDTNE